MASKVLLWLMLWTMAIFYGIVVIFKILWAVITKGYGKVFHKTAREKPAFLVDPDLGTHGFLQLEDVKIHYVAKGSEDSPLMLLVHGFPEFWYCWRHQLLEFSKDYRCVAIDMRGYGESDKPLGMDNYTMAYLMKDIKQVIDALGYKSCVLVSHDWGGSVAWAFARYHADYVDRLIVMNAPAAPVLQTVMRTDKRQRKMSWFVFFFQLARLPETMIGSEDFSFFDTTLGNVDSKGKNNMITPLSTEEIEAYKYTFSQPGDLTPIINYYRAAMRRERSPYDLNYTMPALLIWGAEDIVLCDTIPDLTEKEAPNILVKKIAMAGHFVQLDAPDKVNETIREWLSSQSKVDDSHLY